MGVMNYKCPSCGAPLNFSGESQSLKCGSCGETFDIKAVKAFNEADAIGNNESLNWEEDETSGSGDWKEGETDSLRVFECPSCAAEIVGDSSMGATECIYCGNPSIIPNQFAGQYRPDYVIPFKVEKEKAMEAFREYCKNRPLLPDDYASDERVEKISGVYVPFWLFDCTVKADMSFTGEKIKKWKEGQYRITETSYYTMRRVGTMAFEQVPVDASKKIDNVLTESIEPFNYDEAVDFETAYLSGYLADKYDVESSSAEKRANKRIKGTVNHRVRNSTNPLQNVVKTSSDIKLYDGHKRYVLLPVWFLNTKYENKDYIFAMNGQTGKFVGNLPISKKKLRIRRYKIAGIVAAIGFLLTLIAKVVL